ncbi:MAG: hypothetical protein R8F63_17785 [Acidimicrobiales bacterium]|nr:hypothetical protein [Acidimicrobiales bacterium]
MAGLLETWGGRIGRLVNSGLSSLKGLEKSGAPQPAWDGDETEPPSAVGCLFAAVAAIAVGLVLMAVVLLFLNAVRNDEASSSNSDPVIDQTDDGDGGTGGNTGPEADASGAGSFVDATNPSALIPAAGTWAIENGMFVPNCGPDDPDPDTAEDTGTIDVWASGAALELKGPDGAAIAFERTAVSETSASYTGGVSFIEMELHFDSPTNFEASITYDGDDECVRRAARGTLTVGDDTRQHGAEPAPTSGAFAEVGIDEAGEGAVAVVTIGTDSYEFFAEEIGTCDPEFFGGFHAVLYSPGFTNSVTIDLVTDDNRVSTVTMNLQDLDLDLVADAEGQWAAVEEGTSAVLDFSIDGISASGSVSFINEDRAFNSANFPLDPIEATFTVTCG